MVSRISPNFDIACQPLTVYAIFKSLVVPYIYLCNYLNILSNFPWIILKNKSNPKQENENLSLVTEGIGFIKFM